MEEQTNKIKLDKHDYELSHAQTDAVPIVDPGIGRGVILRHFFFKANPVPKGYPKPTKLQLISHFKRLIEMSLWGDGLIIREDKPLELHTRSSVKKVSRTLYTKMIEENADFVILVLAEARAGVTITDTIAKLK